MDKCGACNSRIIAGGTQWAGWNFCNEDCASGLKIALTDRYVPANEIEDSTLDLHKSNCILCGKDGPNDVYSSKKVTGMILAVQWLTEQHVCCYKCAKKKKLSAGFHCILLGWWSPKAAITNLIYIPYNFIGALLTKPTQRPSKHLGKHVKMFIANKYSREFAEKLRNDE